jgi:hypothetical protein
VDGKFPKSLDAHVKYIDSRRPEQRLHMDCSNPIQSLQPKIFQRQ